MSIQLTKPTFSIFGGSGPTGSYILALALKAGFHVHALARNPSKLIEILLTKDVSEEDIRSRLEITAGDVRDINAVKKVLLVQGIPAARIISCVGMADADAFGFSNTPGQTICEDATRTIMQALAEIDIQEKPHFVALSSSGARLDGYRDYPLLFWLLYNLVLLRPTTDKRNMDQVITEAEREGNKIGGYTIVKPSVLTNATSSDPSKIRVGTADQPAIGYTISREDVGSWIFNNLVEGDTNKWHNERVTITY